MERLTEQHYKKTDGYYMKCSEHCCKEDFSCEDCEKFDELVDRLAAIEDILGDEYDLDRLRELVELYKNVPHICDYCIGCEIEPTDGHGCDGYDNFVFSVRRIVAALKAREEE